MIKPEFGSGEGSTVARSRGWWRRLAVVAAVSTIAWWCWPPRPIQPPTGDGTFTDLSWRVWAFGVVPAFDVRGYAVSMPGFDLGEPHRAAYHVARLPAIGRDCTLYLAIDDPQNVWLFKDREIKEL